LEKLNLIEGTVVDGDESLAFFVWYNQEVSPEKVWLIYIIDVDEAFVTAGRQLTLVTRYTLMVVMKQGSSLIPCATLASAVCHQSEMPQEIKFLL
jgi:hypothetical protein